VRATGSTQRPLASRWLPSDATANAPAILNGLRAANDIGLNNTSAAAFGQLSWRVQPGLRVNYDGKEGRCVSTVTNGTRARAIARRTGGISPRGCATRSTATTSTSLPRSPATPASWSASRATRARTA
jgi:iron complex outermembrane receptor protein